MNIRLWELDNGDTIRLDMVERISKIQNYYNYTQGRNEWNITIYQHGIDNYTKKYVTEDEAKLARFKLVERWNACLDMIYSQTWCPESGTYSSSSKPIEEDKYEGYKESDH